MSSEYNFAYALSRCTYENCRDVRFCVARLEAGKIALDSATPEDGIVEWLCFTYLHDVWIGESATDHANSNDIALLVWEGGARPESVTARTWRKLQNLRTAIVELELGSRKKLPELSMELTRRVHRIVMDTLLDTPGEFRTRHAAPAGYSTTYAPPSMISKGLSRLIDSVNGAMRNCLSATDALRIAVVFLERFLLIHPFVNGNGRVARLLMYVLLHPFMPVPFTIPHDARSEYLDALDDAHNHMNYDRLLHLVLRHAARQSARVEWMVYH